MDKKILLVLQFWERDRTQALKLARLLADIQYTHCSDADFLLVHRFDCSAPDADTVKYISRKFRVSTYRCPRRGIGWPNGCNELWFGVMEWFYHLAEAKKIPHYKAIFTFEADCVPLHREWIKILVDQWDVVNEISPVVIAGRKVESEHVHEHINGNCFVSSNFRFLKWLVKQVGSAPPNQGWDYCMADDFRRWGWAEIPGMECRWGTKTATKELLDAEVERGIVWLHGVKDDSALNYARKILT